MKKAISGALLLMLLTAVPSFAQFKQGTIMIGGAFTGKISSDKTHSGNTTVTNDTYNSESVTPMAGYFIFDNFALGLGADLTQSSEKQKVNTSVKENYHSASFSPFARYYYRKFFVQGQFGLGGFAQKNYNADGSTNKSKGTILNYNLAIGYVVFITPNVAFEPMVGYGYQSQKYNDPTVRYINEGLTLQGGFQIYLHR